MVPSTMPKMSSGTTLDNSRPKGPRKFFQVVSKFSSWHHVLHYLKDISIDYLKKEGLTLATTSFRGSYIAFVLDSSLKFW